MGDHGQARAARAGRRRRRCRGRTACAGAARPAGSAGRRACPDVVEAISVAQRVEQILDRALEQLQRDVAGEAVGDDDVRGAAQQLAALERCPRSSSVARRAAARARRASARCPSRPPRRSRAAAPRGSATPSSSSAEDRPHVGELQQVLGAGVGVRAGVEQHGDGPSRAGIGTAIAGRITPGHPAQVQQAGGEHRAGVPGRHDGVGLARADRPDRGDEARVRLRPHGFGGLVGHLDPVGRLDERQARACRARRGP